MIFRISDCYRIGCLNSFSKGIVAVQAADSFWNRSPFLQSLLDYMMVLCYSKRAISACLYWAKELIGFDGFRLKINDVITFLLSGAYSIRFNGLADIATFIEWLRDCCWGSMETASSPVCCSIARFARSNRFTSPTGHPRISLTQIRSGRFAECGFVR